MRPFKTSIPIAFGIAGSLIWQCIFAVPMAGQGRDNSKKIPPPCTALPSTADSVHVVAVAKLISAGKTQPIPASYASLIIETLRANLRPPSQMTLDIFGSVDSLFTQAMPYVGAHAYFTLRAGKPPEKVAFGTATMHPDLHAALVSAIFALHGDSLPPFPGNVDKLDVELKVYTEPDTGKQVDGLFRATLPQYPVSGEPRMLSGAGLSFPYAARVARKTDTIKVAFVIGTDGYPIEATLDPLKGTYRDFADEVLRKLPKMKYVPLQIGGCSVKMYTQQEFNFKFR